MMFHQAVTQGGDNLSWLGPALLFAGSVVVGLINFVAAIVRRRQDRRDFLTDQSVVKIASESEDWDEVRAARSEATKYYNFYISTRDSFHQVQGALRFLIRMIQNEKPSMELPPNVTEAAQLTSPDSSNR